MIDILIVKLESIPREIRKTEILNKKVIQLEEQLRLTELSKYKYKNMLKDKEKESEEINQK